jgi:hypothetical protein
MATLTCNFHVVATRVTARFAAVFLSGWCIAQAGYVRALIDFLIYHFNAILSVANGLLTQRRDLHRSRPNGGFSQR